MPFLITLILILAGSYGAVKFFNEVILRGPQKRKFDDRLTEIWLGLEDSGPLRLVQAPIRGVSTILEFAFGSLAVSVKSFKRASVIIWIFLATVASTIHLQNGDVFSSLGQPGENYDILFEFVSSIPDLLDGEIPPSLQRRFPNNKPPVPQSAAPAGTQLPPVTKAKIIEISQKFYSYNNPTNRTIYVLLFFPALFLTATLFSYASLVLARQSLNDVADAKSLTSLFSLGLGNLFFLTCLAFLGTSLLAIIAFPFLWPCLWGIFYAGGNYSWLIAGGLFLPLVTLIWSFGPTWIKILAGAFMAPELLVILLCVSAFLIFPFRHAARRATLWFIERGVSHDDGFLAFATIFLASLLALTMAIAKFLGGKPLW